MECPVLNCKPQPTRPGRSPGSNLRKRLGCIGFALWLHALPGNAAPEPAAAPKEQANPPKKTRSPKSRQILQTLENLFVPPQGKAPKSTASSATRNSGKCAAEEGEIQALLPPQNYGSQNYGLSATAHPAITLNLPSTAAKQVALLFRNQSGELEQQVWLPIPPRSTQQGSTQQLREGEPSSQLTQFQLPPSSPGLQPGQPYRWSLVVVCGDTVEPDDPTFTGWIEYREPTAVEQAKLSASSAPEKLRWYGQQGYWYDMLDQ